MSVVELYLFLFLAAFTLHNLEEFIWLPSWYKKHKGLERKEFGVAVLIVTLLSYIVVFLYHVNPSNSYFKFAVIGFLGGMIINVFLPHTLETIRTKSYMPGLTTGVLLLLPVNGYTLFRFVKDGVSMWYVVASSLVVGILLIGVIALTFKLWKVFTSTSSQHNNTLKK